MGEAPNPTIEAPAAVRRRWATLAVLCLSVFLVVVDNTIVNVALPTFARELGATTSQLQWIVDAYALVFAGLLLAGGSLGDRYGRKGALQVGLVLFALTSGLAALATSAGQLVAARAAMGVGAPSSSPPRWRSSPASSRSRASGRRRSASGRRSRASPWPSAR